MQKPNRRSIQWHNNKRRRRTRRLRALRRKIGTALAKPSRFPNITLKSPEILSFINNNLETMGFFHRIRTEIDRKRHRNQKLMVDLSPLNSISIACALCIVAEFDRWQRKTGRILLPITVNNWNQEVKRLLAELGFFKLLNTKLSSSHNVPTTNSTRYINFFSSDVADPTLTANFRAAVGRPLAQTSSISLDLFRSLSEAIANAVEHAYRDDDPQFAKRWWLTGSIDHENHRLSVVVFDHGMGIPGSLPHSRRFQEIISMLKTTFRLDFVMGSVDDGKIIEAAMEVGRSRLRQPQRGKGLGDVLKLAMADPTNRLRVISGRGYYDFEAGSGRSRLMELGLMGTLIEWNLALPVMDDAGDPRSQEPRYAD